MPQNQPQLQAPVTAWDPHSQPAATSPRPHQLPGKQTEQFHNQQPHLQPAACQFTGSQPEAAAAPTGQFLGPDPNAQQLQETWDQPQQFSAQAMYPQQQQPTAPQQFHSPQLQHPQQHPSTTHPFLSMEPQHPQQQHPTTSHPFLSMEPQHPQQQQPTTPPQLLSPQPPQQFSPQPAHPQQQGFGAFGQHAQPQLQQPSAAFGTFGQQQLQPQEPGQQPLPMPTGGLEPSSELRVHGKMRGPRLSQQAGKASSKP